MPTELQKQLQIDPAIPLSSDPTPGQSLQASLAGGGSPFDYSINTAPDIQASQETNPNGNIRPLTAGQAMGMGRGIGGNPNNQRPFAVGEKEVHDVWGTHKVPVDAAGNEVNLFSSGTHPAFSAADYAAAPKVPREEQGTFHRDTPEDQANIAKSQQAVTYAAPGQGQTTSPSTPAQQQDPLLDAILRGNGGGAGRGRDPFANYYAARQSELRALQDRKDAQMHMNDANAVGADMARAEYQQEAQDITKDAESHDAALGKQMDAIDAASREAADMKIDTERYDKNRGLGTRFTDAIAAGLIGFSIGMHGGGNNPILQKLMHERDQDIAAQEKEIESKKGRVADMRGTLAQMYQRFGNMDQAKAATRLAKLQEIEAQTKAYAGNPQNEIDAADADRAMAQIRSEIEKEKATYALKAGAGVDPLKRAAEYVNLKKGMAEIGKTEAETAKMNREGTGEGAGLTPEQRGKEQLDKRELGAALATLDQYKGQAGQIAAGSTLGAHAAHLPSAIPGVADAKQHVTDREAYNNYVMGSMGLAYRLQTGSPEPKNLDLLKKEAEPFEIQPNMNAEDVRRRQVALQQYLARAGASRGPQATPGQQLQQQLSGPTPPSLKVVPGT